jgi:phytoene synthase
MSEAAEITRRAKSNLAFALRILPPRKRRDAVVFYAFCRTLDDLADDHTLPLDDRRARLLDWKQALNPGSGELSELQRAVVELQLRCGIPVSLLTAVIDGCLADLEPRRFVSWTELDAYIWQVACAVGRVSARLFGCKDPAVDAYADALGRALQLTNILRDIGEDLERGRLYLPLEDLDRFGLKEADLAQRVESAAFLRLMAFEADRVDAFHREARERLPAADRPALAPALIMADVYSSLLGRMRRGGFLVFRRRYRVPAAVKLAALVRHLPLALRMPS